ncbi:cysteine desulfurase [Histoplasma capsulatum var. duboisii H88]|uniref:cysteine desulfurase n=1 Tax=Ajellomyces capsulatus (strain H88) TaxID=544711 RepID=F0UPJ9_AJEC8|nr:cysteine desulfurase [Histoplasma capsulatum var. duboisii H88]
MALPSEGRTTIRSFLTDEEIIEPTSDRYASATDFWTAYKNPKPQLVLRPKSLPALQKTVQYLCASDLDFSVRSGGNNTSGAKHVQLSMSAFDSFEFDQDSETVTIGAGQTWGEVDRKVEEAAPGYTVLSTRVPFVGVAGSLLLGGMSWFSGEHGLCSDPHNLLDAHVVLPDGRMLWASTEPDLLWALRGGGGNFGASLRSLAGNTIMLSSPLVDTSSIDPDFVVRIAKFYEQAVEANKALGSGTLVVLEVLGKIFGPNYERLRHIKTKYDPKASPQTGQLNNHAASLPSITMSNLAPSAFRQALRAYPRRCASIRPAAPRTAAARRCYTSESKPARAQSSVDLDVDVAIKTGQRPFAEQTGIRPHNVTVPGTAVDSDAMMGPSTGILKQATVLDQGNRPIYLDMQATTPTDPRVLDAMLPFLTGLYGNPHSRTHAYGWETEKATEQAREHVAKLIGADPKEIIFTSGATESNNMSIKGVAKFFGRSGKKKHIITSQTEHKCVLDSCRHLQDEGFEVTYLPVQSNGLIDLKDLEAAIRPETALVSIMTVNNEIGVIQPVKEIGALCRSKRVFFHTDAAQAVGKIPIDVNEWNVDLLSISGHKIYGPKGIGACYVRRRPRVRIDPIITGGGQERGLRSGTLAPHLAVGIGEACRIAKEEMEYDAKRIKALSKRLLDGLLSMEHTSLNGDPEKHYPGCVNVSFAYVEGESLLMALKDIALSSGSACTSASLEPSYVLRALGNSDESAHSSIRFGIGRFTTESEIDYVLKAVRERVSFLRELSPLWELVQEGVDLNTIEWSQH